MLSPVSAAVLLALPLSALAHSRPEGAHAAELLARAAKESVTPTPTAKAAKVTTYADGNTFLTSTLPSVFPAGATAFPGAPALPNIASIDFSVYPPLDKLPPTDSKEVKAWMKEIDWSKVPDAPVTGLNACSNTTFSAQALKDSGPEKNCWWTCQPEGSSLGHCERDTDINTCPEKGHWGLTYDDGPSPSTPRLLQALEQHNLKATFFVVGSRVVSRPEMLQSTHMLGHQISVHTWAHPSLTTLSNEGVVAELGWARKAIKDVLGVTPNTMRPPFGDIDDRVRAISMQMGLTPIIWTVNPKSQLSYDTFDWQIGEPGVTEASVFNNFQTIIESTKSLDSGFILLEHDLQEEPVDLAVEKILPEAIAYTPALTMEPVITCLGFDMAQAYVETFDKDATSNLGGASASSSGSAAATTASSATKGSKASSTSAGAKASGVASQSAAASATAVNQNVSGAEKKGVWGALGAAVAAVGAVAAMA